MIVAIRMQARIADAVSRTGQMSDPTAGATHFLNPTVVAEAGRFPAVMGAWRGTDRSAGTTFYYPNEGSAAPWRADLSMGELDDPSPFRHLQPAA